ncbi:MAG: response regulator transcription factor [Deltaproteobacteria bacterium]
MMHVVIVEDDPLGGSLLREYVDGGEVRVNALYTSGEEAVEALGKLPLPDVILMDVGLPGMSGIETTEIIKKKYPSIEIIIQTIFEDAEVITDAIKAGATGYLLKASPKEEILKAIWEVKSGGSYLSGKIARKVLQQFNRSETTSSQEGLREESAHRFQLTPREELILGELIRGASYKMIADALCISVHTVNNHVRKIYEKMHVNSRGEAVALATGWDEGSSSIPR